MSAKPASSSKKTGKKGFETEEIVRSYFLGAGFFVVRGVKLRHGDDELTDIDLWLYERSATLARRRIIIDIKDNAQPKAAERLFFVKGLAELIQVEATGIATSDTRRSLRELARKHNVLWIDNADLQRLKSSQRLTVSERMTDEDLNVLISKVDNSRISKNVRDVFAAVKSAVADRFGPSCANTALDGAQYFSRKCVESYPSSLAAQVFTRLTYFCCAIAAAALDFASGESALRPHQERLKNLTDVIRFGEDPKGTAEKLKWAEAAVRDFAPNGMALAEVIRNRLNDALRSVPAENLAEISAKMANSDRLFNAARDLEQAAFAMKCPGFDDLTVDAKSFVGAVLDFVSTDRMVFAKSWTSAVMATALDNSSSSAVEIKAIEDVNDGKLL
ncbi:MULTISPECIES: hypothetical protein [unclassified Novosphingobium]|uniref:hypothetical protein n=1 Tax=unclassified Novosphingobium TaxID=2644732 RepID=UPI000D3009B6|nr:MULTISPECIES: hypothetical protein [unclassified Novosphingobium]PTR12828.1 hypothetical protein C8K11_102287 [Novosphingobium sp. GV055]PUB06612.1 hypothetical protein C8K12_102287 [Novosphingobium sp. GV061]PUB22663.1 hypothetical protein C8K14_102287 [Novosphingobium sp. GV079]PUB44688.1 hypothetical protein C8K10_102287 [Novosphingobium sp. GV027]